MQLKEIELYEFWLAVMSDSLQSSRLLCPWDFLGKNTRVGCHFLLQGIFPTQELNLGLLHCRQILYQLSYKGSPWSSIPGSGTLQYSYL